MLILSFSIAKTETITLSKKQLQDKIKGGWAGQLIGCTFGGPTEFRWNSTFIPEHVPIKWDNSLMEWWYDNAPGLYDDIYMDLTFVQVFEEKGLDAPAEDFARAFAYAEYPLWHANNMARWNIKHGLLPPESGHWLNNPHADDIDYQIEADYAGLMSPGMPNTASEISDRIGHIMNYGDGWYGGVYVGALYALAFVYDDVDTIVKKALKTIPEESDFYKCQADVIKYYNIYPNDWKMTWLKVQENWGNDIGCPDGVYRSFNIDAKINSAWIILGLLYGQGDFGETISISTRAGDDSDCNPASSGGILGTLLGYENIPEFWKQGIDKVADRDFKYTTISLNDANVLSYKHALQVIEDNGGTAGASEVSIQVQNPKPVALEVGFKDHFPVERRRIGTTFTDESEVKFKGIGFVATGSVRTERDDNLIVDVEMWIDDQLAETISLSTAWIERRETLFWKYQLPRAQHTIRFKVLNPKDDVVIEFGDMIVYDNKPIETKY